MLFCGVQTDFKKGNVVVLLIPRQSGRPTRISALTAGKLVKMQRKNPQAFSAEMLACLLRSDVADSQEHNEEAPKKAFTAAASQKRHVLK